MQPIPDTGRHFGSSSSLWRHPSVSGPMTDLESIRSAVTEQGPFGVWGRLVGFGALCNDASIAHKVDGNYMGQATDVALLNALSVSGLPDPRQASSLRSLLCYDMLSSYYQIWVRSVVVHTVWTGPVHRPDHFIAETDTDRTRPD
jgi:hypothetical protein